MRTLKPILLATIFLIVLLMNTRYVLASEQVLSADVTLTDGHQIYRSSDPGRAIYPFRQAACDLALQCSHPDKLYRGGGFVALTGSGQHIEAICEGPTPSIGVQLRGDDNDGYARVLVDGKIVWAGNTYGHGRGGHLYIKYLEISGLSRLSHTVRVEAMGLPGRHGGNVHVAVVGFRCNAPHDGTDFRLYLPVTPQLERTL